MSGIINNEKHAEAARTDVNVRTSYGFGIRHVQMFCMWFCMISLFIVRCSMGVAVLAMTDTKNNNTNIEIYDWGKETQGIVLSSFFWGYVIMQIPAGMLAKKFGGKPIILFALVANGVLCSLLPTLSSVGGWGLVCASRIAMGLTQACLFPASHTLLGRWLPAHERTTYTGIVYAGSQIGTIIGMPVSGVLAGTAMGWKLIFYSMSALMMATAVLWYALAASSPGQHRLISAAEKEYIEWDFKINSVNKGPPSTPWGSILRSLPVWAIVVTHIGANASYILFFVDMPTYLEKALGISFKDSASLSALPYIGMWVGNVVAAVLSQWVSNKGLLPITMCRKICNSIALYGVAVGLLVLSFLGPDQKQWAVVTLVGILMLTGFTAAGFMVNHLDLSPNFAGVLLSLTNFVANVMSVITPIFTGVILGKESDNVGRWRIVFMTIAALSAVTNTIYICFATSDKQAWDDPDFKYQIRADPEEMKPVLNQDKEKKENKSNQQKEMGASS